MTKPNHKLTKLMFASLRVSVLRNEKQSERVRTRRTGTMSIENRYEAFMEVTVN